MKLIFTIGSSHLLASLISFNVFQARVGSASPSFTPADLVRSVNKRIRQTYLKKRLLTTYKALERMTEMGFNLEKLKEVVNEGELATHPELVNLLSSTAITSQAHKKEATASAVVAANISQLGVTSTSARVDGTSSQPAAPAGEQQSAASGNSVAVAIGDETSSKQAAKVRASDKSLSCKEIERDRGKPLSKYDRNVMIFDWLHSLDESATATIDLS